MVLIQLENICKTYPMGGEEVHALREVSVSVLRGENLAIMGPSGSGKSTLMNILGCLDTPTSGTYILNDSMVSQLNENELAAIRNREIGFVFQTFNLLPRGSALYNVELPLVYSGMRRAKRRDMAMRALELVGLADRIHHKPNELSGGQRQRVAIARALVNRPSLLLADEPTGNLDSATSREIMELLLDLNRQGTTLIVVTHEPDIAEYASRVVNILDGKIVRDERKNGNSGLTGDANERESMEKSIDEFSQTDRI